MEHTFNRQEWEEFGLIVETASTRYIGQLALPAVALAHRRLQSDLAAMMATGEPFDLSPAFAFSAFEVPSINPQDGSLVGIARSVDVGPVFASDGPMRVIVKATAVIHLQWFDDGPRGALLRCLEGAYRKASAARVARAGIVQPSPLTLIGLKNGGRS